MGRTLRNRPGVDAYLFPSVIGGGFGDVVEVRDAGRRLRDAGFPVFLYEAKAHPRTPLVHRLVAGAPFRRVRAPVRANPRALVIAPMWGVSAAPARDEPFGRAGEWDPERRELEAAYGVGRVLHVSLEEFARTLTSREETLERYREGGRLHREIRRHLSSPRGRREIQAFHDAYRKFRAFDRAEVLHLFATFRPSVPFAREYPEAVQTGPLWPPRAARSGGAPRPAARSWIWYASPSSSARIAPQVHRGLAFARPPVRLTIRGGGRALGPAPADRVSEDLPTARAWGREVDAAELRIVTGSRTLLEALSDGVPFLYFNGIVGDGRSQRRHRPEKIRSLLGAWRSEGVRRTLWRDLDAFSRGRRVERVVARAAQDPEFRAGFRPRWRPTGFRAPYEDAGALLVQVASEWAESHRDAPEIVRDWRTRAGTSGGGAPERPRSAIRV